MWVCYAFCFFIYELENYDARVIPNVTFVKHGETILLVPCPGWLVGVPPGVL